MTETNLKVILHKVLRERLHWNAGTRLALEHTVDGVLLKPLTTAFAPTRPESVFGCLAGTGEPRSTTTRRSPRPAANGT